MAVISVLSHIRTTDLKNPKVLAAIAGILVIIAILLAFVATIKNEPLPPKQAATTAQISITSSGFIPATLSIASNTKVVWTNSDTKTHQIQANPHPTGDSLPELKSKIINQAQTYEFTFTKPGSFNYHDHLNPTSNGAIEVK